MTAVPRTSLDHYLRSLPGRCPSCGFHVKLQGCACEGERLKSEGQQLATAAHPDDRSKVEAAIKKLAASGREFSSNDARSLHGVSGPVVGATFTAARKAGLIRAVGFTTSTDPGTHAHPVRTWIGAAA